MMLSDTSKTVAKRKGISTLCLGGGQTLDLTGE
jgi:hypothetical protein